MKFTNHYNYKPHKGEDYTYVDEKTGETKRYPSKTVPDQAMTITQIVDRSRKGLPITGVRVPMYNEGEDGIMPDLRNMDISEIYALKQQIARKEKEIRKSLEEQEEQKRLQETEEYYRKKFATKPVVDKNAAQDPEQQKGDEIA